MSRNYILGLLAAVVVLGGGYYLFTKGQLPAAPGHQQNHTTTTEQAGTVNGSFADLAKRTGDWKCTIDASTAESASSGTVYISGGKVRGTFSTAVQGYGNVDSHLLVEGEDVYTWSSMMPQGIKTKVTAQGQGGTTTSGQAMDANQQYSYDCQPWAADAAVFVRPANITFTTIGQ